MDVCKQETQISRAWELLAPALGDDLRIIQSEVCRGECQLLSWGGGEFFTVLREEQFTEYRELVLVAAAGKNSMPYLHEIHRRAKLAGFKSIRLHTSRPASMLRMGKSLGYAPAETILRAVLNG
ncbi:hypothetical protein FLM48_11050 [Shewanella sp. Scap07]|uniref:hypothetical protein n=1 Tax=Shewanella sp. Scap07 TaxID=2589987 RepID=UPI0015BDFC8E|nr:hypothetical protein [Shewanella sp. Scap07]QLE85567.1 hypothetical protein FLM48_11050 [Shewanella sp. Scap07]